MEEDALKLCRALGYDLNTVEFAVEEGVPYAIDFMNPVPDADVHSVGEANFEWIVDAGCRSGHRQRQGGAARPEQRGRRIWAQRAKSSPRQRAKAKKQPASAANETTNSGA